MMTDPSDSYDRTAYIRTGVLHRCPELTDADLALLATESDDTLPRQIAEQILTVLDSMMDRLNELNGNREGRR
jgi:hypothetical protein